MTILADVICSQASLPLSAEEIKNNVKSIAPDSTHSKIGSLFASLVSQGRLVKKEDDTYQSEDTFLNFSPDDKLSDTYNIKSYLVANLNEEFNIAVIQALFPKILKASATTAINKWINVQALMRGDHGSYTALPALNDVNVRKAKGKANKGKRGKNFSTPAKKVKAQRPLLESAEGMSALEALINLESQNKKYRRVFEGIYNILVEEGLIAEGEEHEEENLLD